LPSSAARAIAFQGHQKSKWHLSFQQLMAASAPAMFSSASNSELSSRSIRPTPAGGSSIRPRAVPLQSNPGPPRVCQKIALWVCSAVRADARELQIVAWVAHGKTNAQIAELLWISPTTVRKHLENVYAKLGVRTRTAAAARFLGALDDALGDA
jgi:DNA-binding CsgD family transcriptional regulator